MRGKFTRLFWVIVVAASFSAQTWAKDQGSVLVYNLYASSAATNPAQNTRISITNTNETTGVAVHLFLVDGTTGLVTDAYLCLAALQTAAFLASDVDPGITGYVMAFATDRNGFPIAFDWLIGEEYVKLQSGHQANLRAEVISVLGEPLSVFVSEGGALATIRFDGVGYERLPRILAVDHAGSTQDGNTTMVVVNHIGGSLATGVSGAGTLFGLVYDDEESAYSSSISVGGCQLRGIFSSSFPRILGPGGFSMVVRRTGWVKFWDNTLNARSYFGAVLRRNNQATPAAFNGGHNMHKLTLNPVSLLQIPITPPRC